MTSDDYELSWSGAMETQAAKEGQRPAVTLPRTISASRERILREINRHPRKSWTCEELERATQLQHGTVLRHTRHLAEDGLLKLEMVEAKLRGQAAGSRLTLRIRKAT